MYLCVFEFKFLLFMLVVLLGLKFSVMRLGIGGLLRFIDYYYNFRFGEDFDLGE